MLKRLRSQLDAFLAKGRPQWMLFGVVLWGIPVFVLTTLWAVFVDHERTALTPTRLAARCVVWILAGVLYRMWSYKLKRNTA